MKTNKFNILKENYKNTNTITGPSDREIMFCVCSIFAKLEIYYIIIIINKNAILNKFGFDPEHLLV